MTEKKIITADGSSIYYFLQKNNSLKHSPTLVFLHGNNGSWHYFSQQISYFSKNYQVLAMDSRGQGNSQNKNDKLTFKLMAEDLAEILQKEHIKKGLLIGFSDGANLAMEFAHYYPEFVAGLVLNSGNIVPFGLNGLINFLTKLQVKLAAFLGHFIPSWKNRFKVFQLMVKKMDITFKDLEKITAPTLVIVGRFDLISLTHSQEIAKAIPHSQFVIIKHAGHTLAKDKPEIFNTQLEKFMKEQVLPCQKLSN